VASHHFLRLLWISRRGRGRRLGLGRCNERYNVQLDVLRQLEQKVKNLIMAQRQSSGSGTEGASSLPQALTKLERDFERVQGLAHAAKAKVTRQQKQLQQRGSTIPAMEENSAVNALQLEQERFQMQMQQDVSQSRLSTFELSRS